LSSRKQNTTNAGEVAGKKELYTLLAGLQINATTMEINMEVLQKTKR
jgi:hypothetical protein